ncbi:MAG: ABC transporter permease [Proteobacteria bacterium]|nr:MAG: ABC transporter permease [Pseudomonadota bacterium]
MILFILAFRNLIRHFRRTLTLLLTVAMGTGALFLFKGFNTGIMNQYKDNTIHAKTGHGQLNTENYMNEVYERPWKHWITEPDKLKSELKTLPEVSHVFPRIDFYSVVTNGSLNVAAKGTGVDGTDEADFFWTINIVKGVTLRDQPDGIILGVGMARALKVNPGDSLTLVVQTVAGRANAVDVTVVGIFHTGMKEIDDSTFRIQRKVAAELIDTDRVESVSIGLKSDDLWPQFAAKIKTNYPQLDATPFEVLDKIYYQNAVDWLGQQFAVIQLIIVFIVTLGITNSFAFSVVERTAEIGNLRANGESAWEITGLLMWEGVLIGLVGSVMGVLSAYLINIIVIPNGILMPPAPGLTRQFHVKIELQWMSCLIACAFGLGATLVATFVACYKRVRIPVGDALRHRS